MGSAEIPSLLLAVRRHLWRQRAGDAVRVALWSTAALLLAAVALHLATRRVPAQPVWGLAALLWLLMLGRAALRMPSPAECALWADRHLQGQSAFSTWLEARNAARSDAAGRRLTAWASAQAVQSRRLLAQRQISMHLVRPLLVMLVSAALAVLVQSLWHAEPARALADAASPAAGADPSRQPADTPAIGPAQADASAAPPRRADGGLPDARPRPADAADAFNPLAVARTASDGPSAGASASATATAAADPSAAAAKSGSATGRDAGDARDERSAQGRSRAAAAAAPAATPTSGTPAPARTATQADMGEAATYDEALQRPEGSGAGRLPAAVAATPPAAGAATRLTPTETTYVQAWMRANAHR